MLQEEELSVFFEIAVPQDTDAKKLKRGYVRAIWEDGKMAGVESISPLLIAIDLEKELHFQLLVQQLEILILNEKKSRLDELYIQQTIYHALERSIRQEKPRFHQYLLERTSIKKTIEGESSLFRKVCTYPAATLDTTSESICRLSP